MRLWDTSREVKGRREGRCKGCVQVTLIQLMPIQSERSKSRGGGFNCALKRDATVICITQSSFIRNIALTALSLRGTLKLNPTQVRFVFLGKSTDLSV